MGHYEIEKSALFFMWKQGVSTLLKSKKNKKEGTVLKVWMPHLETCGLQTGHCKNSCTKYMWNSNVFVT